MASMTGPWTRIPITRIEDLGDAVLGAGLEATQMSAGALSGSLAFAAVGGAICTSGLIGGRVALDGPLSQDGVTLGIGLAVPAGATHWHRQVEVGNIGVFLPNDEHASQYTEGSFYVTLTLAQERLEEEAAQLGLVLDRRTLGGTGFHRHLMNQNFIAAMRERMRHVHAGRQARGDGAIGAALLAAAIRHLARPPHAARIDVDPGLYGRIVRRARDYIAAHLAEPMTVDEIAAAAFTSRRTLFRAFADLLDETPRSYVQRMRLHRIRRDLASEAEAACSIALIASEWGIGDPGRMAGRYRELFGERPAETLARRLQR